MLATLISATLLSAFTIRGALAEFSIATIELTQCASAHITWTEATAPYNMAVVPADDPCDKVLVDLGDHKGLSMTWNNVTVPAGTKVMFSLLDSSDEEAWSGTITVKDGDDSCLPSSSSSKNSTDSSGSGSATTLTLTSSYKTASAASSSETATAVGAANAGTLGNASGAMSNVHLPAAATIFASLAAVAAALAL
ncbi:uncharacterized protein FOMMEDRAFT_138509 [Fomitiporia mediterranea MF3/22]|uniref:uncharacterized protein n=1 Tax=Fomitiporia mediterranea (strain MF3/22) TaxID=694068 RepID=UPI0004408486|nr:uncharacterized protein FOMMEDRAFT_138509 [Fomitiporia mediterranea MF3/22]EJD06613.1 hypothetical protein FOMMEDRAFT_138509 [Fomitiporia mediterranea MF3/22]